MSKVNVRYYQRRARRRRLLVSRTIKIVFVLAVTIGMLLFLRHMYLTEAKVLLSRDEKVTQTLSDEVIPGQIPMFFQYDSRWKDENYGDGTMEFNGCGPTCLSMVLCGLNGTAEYDPVTVAKLADTKGYYEAGAGSAWTLMSELSEELDLKVHEVRFDESHIRQELKEKRPIICVVGPGDFTTTGHFIVLCGLDSDGRVIVHDPNSEERSRRTWEIGELMPQIKNLWSYS